MGKILVIANREKDKCGRIDLVVSHGIDLYDNDKIVILPQVSPSSIGAIYDPKIGEFILED